VVLVGVVSEGAVLPKFAKFDGVDGLVIVHRALAKLEPAENERRAQRQQEHHRKGAGHALKM
jgi:hypothetical protein